MLFPTRRVKVLETTLNSSQRCLIIIDTFRAAARKDYWKDIAPSAPGYLKLWRVAAMASMILLISALLGRWPYGFYVLLRVVVCGSAVYPAVDARRRRSAVWVWTMFGIVIVFNPFVLVPLPRSYWQVLDLVALVLFGILLFKLQGRRGEP